MGDNTKKNEPSSRVDDVTATLARGEEPELPSTGEKIQFFREYLGISREKFANTLGNDVSRTTVYRWEKNHAGPSASSYEKMLKIARERGGLRQLVGTNEREIMLIRLNEEMPAEGVAALIDFAVDEESHIGRIMVELFALGAKPIKFAALGDGTDAPKTEALLLVQLDSDAMAKTIGEYLRTSDLVHDPHLALKSRNPIDFPLQGRPGDGRSR